MNLIEADIADQERTSEYFSGVNYVFHQAAVPSVPRSIAEPWLTNNSNVNGTLAVLENCRLNNVMKVVFAASSSAYGDTKVLPKDISMKPSPLSPYAVQKLTGEMYCKTYFDNFGLRTTSLRYFNVYGPHQDPSSEYSAVIPIFIKKALENKSIMIFGDGTTSRDFTFIVDVIQANLRAAISTKSDGHVVNVGYGDRFTLTELANKVIENIGSSSTIEYADFRKGDVLHSLADISTTKDLIDYVPQFDLSAGLSKTIDFYKK
ncbi:MAG: NAD-dependent epimerase/dehydratase family protein [Candidatus Poseidoniales archaeon]